jgi:hypothetical protein
MGSEYTARGVSDSPRRSATSCRVRRRLGCGTLALMIQCLKCAHVLRSEPGRREDGEPELVLFGYGGMLLCPKCNQPNVLSREQMRDFERYSPQ